MVNVLMILTMQRYNISRAIPNIEARDVQKYVNDTFPHRKRHI